MKTLAALFCIVAITLGSSTASATGNGADCFTPLPIDIRGFDFLGPHLFLTDIRIFPNGSYGPLVQPLWVDATRHVGEFTTGPNVTFHKIEHKDENTDTGPNRGKITASPFYIVEIGKTGSLPAPIIASGSRVGEMGGEGKLSIHKVVEVFGKAETGTKFISTKNGVDYQFVRIPLGKSGLTLAGITRGMFQLQSSTAGVIGAVHPGGGFSLEVPAGDRGESLRIGIIAGPNFSIRNGDAIVSPAISGGAQLILF